MEVEMEVKVEVEVRMRMTTVVVITTPVQQSRDHRRREVLPTHPRIF